VDPELRAYLDQRFEAIDQRFEAIDQRFEAVDRRFDAVDQRFEAVDRRFVAQDERFAAQDRRFDHMDAALRHQGVLLEALRDDFHQLADAHLGFHGRLERHRQESAAAHAEILALLRTSYQTLDRRVTRLERRLGEDGTPEG
jgi:chromosome segregation ATPase